MTHRKITIRNSVKYITQSEQMRERERERERDSKPNTIRNYSNPRKQNKHISQNNKNFIEKIAAEGFGILK